VKLPRRAVAWTSRRFERPELLAAVDRHARLELRGELAMRAVLAASLREDSTYVDVGTNRGQVLAQAALLAPRARLIAFEPVPELAAQLRASFPSLDCRELALGATEGSAEFTHFRKLDGWSGLQRSPEISDERGAPEQIEVRVSTLDRELAAGPGPDVLKIDVEGGELDVLRGGRETLARSRPLIVFEHVAAAAALYGAASGELWDELSALGYEVLALTGGPPLDRAAFCAPGDEVNWLARPRREIAGSAAGAQPSRSS
jgi:FkbM family methyltransferase